MKSTLHTLITEGLQYIFIILVGTLVYAGLEIGIHMVVIYYYNTGRINEVQEYQHVLQLAQDRVRNMIATHTGNGPESLEPVNEYGYDRD